MPGIEQPVVVEVGEIGVVDKIVRSLVAHRLVALVDQMAFGIDYVGQTVAVDVGRDGSIVGAGVEQTAYLAVAS